MYLYDCAQCGKECSDDNENDFFTTIRLRKHGNPFLICDKCLIQVPPWFLKIVQRDGYSFDNEFSNLGV